MLRDLPNGPPAIGDARVGSSRQQKMLRLHNWMEIACMGFKLTMWSADGSCYLESLVRAQLATEVLF